MVPGKRIAAAPAFVLTSSRTFSGAEEFSYNLKNLKRATIVGETTGGAHTRYAENESKIASCLECRWPVRSTRPRGPIGKVLASNPMQRC